MRRLTIIFMLTVFTAAIEAVCQTEGTRPLGLRGFVTGSVGVFDNLGYKNPSLSIGGGVEMKSKPLLTVTQFTLSRTSKIETNDGHSAEWETTSFTRLGGFLLGGGAKYSQLTTSQWQKNGWRPFVAGGYEGNTYRLQCRYILSSFDVQNHLSGVLGIYEFRKLGHWGVEIRYGIFRFQDTRVPGVYYAQPAEKHTGAQTALGLKYFF